MFGGRHGAGQRVHIQVVQRGVLRIRVPFRSLPETALCENAHLVFAPGGVKQEAGREEEGGGEPRNRGCYVTCFCFPSHCTELSLCFHHDFWDSSDVQNVFLASFNAKDDVYSATQAA